MSDEKFEKRRSSLPGSEGIHTNVFAPDPDTERKGSLVVTQNRRESALDEGATVLGSTEKAARNGYVQRGLKSRHIQFIALGGTIGTGLFLGIGQALADYGPLSILLAYSISGVFIWGMMQSLGEMAAWLPLPGAIPQYASRFVDPAMGFATGWNQWYSNAITQVSELTAAASLIGYWDPTVNPAAWIAIVWVTIVCLNIFAVKIYGEAEFWFSAIKIITILGLLIFAFISDLGGVPGHGRLGFQYWRNPGAMPPFILSGSAGRFLSFFSTLVNALFAYGGVETVAVAAGESENPRKNIPKAVRRVFWRILFFYVLGSLAVGVLVPYTDDALLGSGTRASPWVLAVVNAGVPALPSIINAVILTSAASSGNSFLYSASRYLYALAQTRQAPALFLVCNRNGVPYVAVSFTAAIGLLAFTSASAGASTVFAWFINLTTISTAFTWCSICVSSIRFQQHLRAQGVPYDQLPFRSLFRNWGNWAALIFFAIVIFFNGFSTFVHGHWSTMEFVSAYVGIPIFFGLYFFWKFIAPNLTYEALQLYRSKITGRKVDTERTKLFEYIPFVKTGEGDIWTGKQAIDDEIWPDDTPTTWYGKLWAFLV